MEEEENNLQQVTQALQKQNEITEDQSARSAAVIESIGERVEDSLTNIPRLEKQESSRSAAVIEKLSADIQNQTKKSVEGVKKQAVSTVKNVPKLAMAQLDPVTATVLGQVGGATKSAFKYVQSFGSVIKGKDEEQKEEQKEEQDETQEQLESIEDTFLDSLDNLDDSINHGFGRLLAFMQGQSLEDYERQREEAIAQEELLNKMDMSQLAGPGQEGGNEELQAKLTAIDIVLTNLSRVGPLLLKVLTPFAVGIGVIVGLVQGYAKELRLIGTAISKVAGLFGKVFSARATGGAFTNIIEMFRSTVTRIRGAFNALSTAVSSMLEPVMRVITRLRAFTRLMRMRVKAAGGFLSKILGGFAKLGNTVKSVAGVVTKLFIPLRFFMVAFETIKGALDGFKEGGFLGGIQGAITGFLKALVGIPFDLIKGIVAFVLDKFGFDNAAEFLRSFSFSEIIADIVAAPFNLLKGAVNWIKKQLGFDGSGLPSIVDIISGLYTWPFDLLRSVTAWALGKLGFDKAAEFLSSFSFSDILKAIVMAPFNLLVKAKDWIVDKLSSVGDFFGNMANTAGNFIRDLLRGILPDPSVDRGFIKNLAVKAIPNDLYRLAGINPETGEVTAGSESEGQLAGLDEGGGQSDEDKYGGDPAIQARVARAQARADAMRAGAKEQGNYVERGSNPAQVQSGDELQMANAEQRNAELEQRVAARAGGQGSGSNVTVASNVTNNSNTTLQNRPSASGFPDNLSDSMMQAGFVPGRL